MAAINITSYVAGQTDPSKFAKDVTNLTVQMIQDTLRQGALKVIGQQTKLDNPPTYLEVDNNSYKPIMSAEKRILILFGVKLVQGAMAAIKNELKKAIDEMIYRQGDPTRELTGRLGDMNNWEWVLVRGKNSPGIVVHSETEVGTFSAEDALVLRPIGVKEEGRGYTVFANLTGQSRNIRQSRLTGRYRRSAYRNAFAGAPQIRRAIGFMGATAKAVRGMHQFKQFSIKAGFSKQFAVAGEASRFGTPFLMLRVKRRGKLK
jgi:hypothetical protein